MQNEWISPKIIVGNTATGTYYFRRTQIVAEIWEEIAKGNNALIAAPRRVGKSSVMRDMVDNCPEGYKCIFENVQGIKSEIEFYKKMYELIISCLNRIDRTKNSIKEWWQELKIEEISIRDGKLKLGGNQLNYLEEIDGLLSKLNGKEIKIILFIDELPEVLHQLNKANKTDEAVSILKNVRRWRQEDQYQNFHLVFAGSIGIHYVVKNIEGRTTDINDFNPIKFDALLEHEAKEYVKWSTDNNATIQYDEKNSAYLLSKIQYYVPYFINLMLDEINKTARRNRNQLITIKDIDEAFDNVVKFSDHFKDWKSRLFDYMLKEEADFLNAILIHISHKNNISQQKIFDIATAHNKVDDRMELIDGLEKDGYIIELKGKYVFLSPFLKAFWKRNNPIYND